MTPACYGTTSLFGAFNPADGTVISSLHRRHRAIEFKKFLQKIDSQVPEQLDVHLICDNYGTDKSPAIRRWLEAHPRFQMHHTPTYAGWINQVERWFAYLTDDLLRPNSVGRARRASFWWRWSVGVRSRSVDGPCGERDRRLGRR